MSILLWHASKISRKFAGVEICSVVLRPRRKPHWVSASFGSVIFVASWHALFLAGLAQKCAVVGSFTPVSFFVYEDDQFANLSVHFQNAIPLDTQPSGVLSSQIHHQTIRS